MNLEEYNKLSAPEESSEPSFKICGNCSHWEYQDDLWKTSFGSCTAGYYPFGVTVPQKKIVPTRCGDYEYSEKERR